MEKLLVTKIRTKKSKHFLVEKSNTTISYPTYKSLKLDYPDIQKSDIIFFNKNGQGVEAPKQTTTNQSLTTGNDMLC